MFTSKRCPPENMDAWQPRQRPKRRGQTCLYLSGTLANPVPASTINTQHARGKGKIVSRNRMDCITDVGGIKCRPSVHATRKERVKQFHEISRNRMDCITDVGGINCRPSVHATREEKESNSFTKFHGTGWIVSRMWWHKLPPSCTRDT